MDRAQGVVSIRSTRYEFNYSWVKCPSMWENGRTISVVLGLHANACRSGFKTMVTMRATRYGFNYPWVKCPSMWKTVVPLALCLDSTQTPADRALKPWLLYELLDMGLITRG